MISQAEIHAVVAAIRVQCEQVARRNGLQCAVVESWLSAVEEKCAQPAIDESAVRVCLRVLERWVSPLSELAGSHAALVRLTTPVTKRPGLVGRPFAGQGWIPPVTPSRGDAAAMQA